jgi:CRP/FNR family cyclic AMP-dependent transcriptional regulator
MFFDDLTPAEISLVESIGKVCKFQRGDFIIREGQTGASFFLVISGRVEVRKDLGEGKHRILVELGACDLLGEVGFLGVIFRSASVVALTQAVLIEFERDDFDQLVQKEPMLGLKVYRGMARELAQRLARTDEEVKDTILWALSESKQDPTLSGAVKPPTRPKLTLAAKAFDPCI